nr:MAG TPA: hypothetical protein [Caudoviricetes sp.]
MAKLRKMNILELIILIYSTKCSLTIYKDL